MLVSVHYILFGISFSPMGGIEQHSAHNVAASKGLFSYISVHSILVWCLFGGQGIFVIKKEWSQWEMTLPSLLQDVFPCSPAALGTWEMVRRRETAFKKRLEFCRCFFFSEDKNLVLGDIFGSSCSCVNICRYLAPRRLAHNAQGQRTLVRPFLSNQFFPIAKNLLWKFCTSVCWPWPWIADVNNSRSKQLQTNGFGKRKIPVAEILHLILCWSPCDTNFKIAAWATQVRRVVSWKVSACVMHVQCQRLVLGAFSQCKLQRYWCGIFGPWSNRSNPVWKLGVFFQMQQRVFSECENSH